VVCDHDNGLGYRVVMEFTYSSFTNDSYDDELREDGVACPRCI